MIADLNIRADGQTFDVASIQAFLLAQPHTARDAFDADRILHESDEDSLDWFIEQRRKDPTRYPYVGILFTTRPNRIGISGWMEDMTLPRKLVQWLRQDYELRFEDADYGGDVTAEVDDDLAFLFGKLPEGT